MERLFRFILFLALANTPFTSLADDEPSDPFPIKKGDDDPTKSKLPRRWRISHYIDGDELVIECNSETTATVRIIDASDSKIVYQSVAELYPEYRCDITGLSGSFILTIEIGDQSYSYLFFI